LLIHSGNGLGLTAFGLGLIALGLGLGLGLDLVALASASASYNTGLINIPAFNDLLESGASILVGRGGPAPPIFC